MENAKMIEMNISKRACGCVPPLPKEGARIQLDVDEFGGRRASLDIKTKGYAIGALATGIEAVAEEFEVSPMELLQAVKLVIRMDLRQEQLAIQTSSAVRKILEVL